MRMLVGLTIPLAALLAASSAPAVVCVDGSAPGPAHDGTSWDTAFLTVQEGIDAATPDGEVWVADGTYVENVVMGAGVQLYGGFLGAEPGGYETDLFQRDFANHVTTIDGNQSGSCVVMAANARVDGLTLTNGGPIGTSVDGGGMCCRELGQGGVITNNTITANSADDGGGIYCLRASPAISSNTISGNRARSYGGGICCWDAAPSISVNTFDGNWSFSSGGGIHVWLGSPEIVDNVIGGNVGERGGGGISCERCSSTIKSNLIIGNLSYAAGGGVDLVRSSVWLVDNTVSRNRSGWTGGGVACRYESHAAIDGNLIGENWADGYGGGVGCTDSSHPLFAGNTIAYNTCAQDGGGIYGLQAGPFTGNTIVRNGCSGSGGGLVVYQSPEIVANTISGNYAAVSGGGIYTYGCDSHIHDNLLETNHAGEQGGGIYLYRSSPLVEMNTVASNSADGAGGGIACLYYSDPTITDNVLVGNRADLGGGLCVAGYSDPIVVYNVIAGNVATCAGGGLSVSETSPVIVSNFMTDNWADRYGGGAYIDYFSMAELANNVIVGNRSMYGAGIACIQASPIVTNNTITSNTATTGAGLFYEYEGFPRVENNIVAWNNAAGGGGIYNDGAELFLHSNDFWENTPEDYLGCPPGHGDIAGDPQFADPTGRDFHLQPTSPCIDTGSNDAWGIPDQDFEGDPRIWDSQGEGSPVVDIGADEYVLLERTTAPDGWFVPGWVWFSIPLHPRQWLDASDVLGFDCTNRLYAWDDAAKTLLLYPDDFVDLAVGPSYVARIAVGEQYGPAYEGSQPDLPFERTLAAGWCWVGVPGTQDIRGLDLRVTKGGVTRTPARDRGVPQPWLNWNWIFWDPARRTAKIMDPFGRGDDEWLHPWWGYRVWSNTENVTIVFP
jgi:parallel beta-helix repeat protein